MAGGDDSFRLLVESFKDYAMFMLDVTGHVISWSPDAQRLKGYRASEIIGKHFSCFYPADAVQRGIPDQNLAAALRDGCHEDEGWRVRKDGTRFWANVIITVLRNKDGSPRGFAKLTRDLTERRRMEQELRESEERFRSFFVSG